MIGRGNSQEEMMEMQNQQAMHQQMQSSLQMEEGQVNDEYLEELIDHGLDEATARLLQNMLSRDFVLGYLQESEVTEMRWLTRNIALRIKRLHPREEAIASGDARKYYLNDDRDGLSPLSHHQENLIDQAVLAILTRVSRSKDGWQQDEMGKQIAVSRMEDSEDDGGIGGGLFS